MATRTGLDFRVDQQRGPASRNRISRFECPAATRMIRETEHQAMSRIVRALAALCPGDVPRRWSVAGLAPDIDIAPVGIETTRIRVVVLLQVGRVALGALVVPVLCRVRPVQHVAMIDLLVWIEMKPALPALLLRARIPRDAERL